MPSTRWSRHVKRFAAEHGCTWAEAQSRASGTYEPKQTASSPSRLRGGAIASYDPANEPRFFACGALQRAPLLEALERGGTYADAHGAVIAFGATPPARRALIAAKVRAIRGPFKVVVTKSGFLIATAC